MMFEHGVRIAGWIRSRRRPASADGLPAPTAPSVDRRASGEGERAPGPNLDAERWSNIAALDRDYAAGKARLSAGPLEAYIEVSARCNLRCQMCPITVDPRYDPHSGRPPLLTRELFDRLESLIPTLRRAYLFGLGEPFLNRDLIDYAERLAGVGQAARPCPGHAASPGRPSMSTLREKSGPAASTIKSSATWTRSLSRQSGTARTTRRCAPITSPAGYPRAA